MRKPSPMAKKKKPSPVKRGVEGEKKNPQYKSVSLKIETYKRAAQYMKFGDTFDGFINKLLDLSKKALV